VDVNRLSRGEQIAGAAAVLLFIDMFLNWYSANLSGALSAAANRFGVDTSVNAWQSFSTTDLLLMLTILAAVTMVGLRVMGRSADLPVSLPLVVAALGALTTLIVLWRIVNQPGPNDFINVEYGAYIGVVLVAALTYGAIQAGGGMDTMRAEAGSLQDRATSSPTPDAPPPPPAATSVAEPPGPPPPAVPATPTGVTQPAPDPVPPPPEPPPEPEPPAPPQPGDDPAGPTAVHDEDEPSTPGVA
jgi:hypothetical protein